MSDKLSRIMKPLVEETDYCLNQFKTQIAGANFTPSEAKRAHQMLDELKTSLIDFVQQWINEEVELEKIPSKVSPFQKLDRFTKVHKSLPAACESCGETRVFHIAHIIPKKDDGPDELENLMRLCGNCHALFDRKILSEQNLRKIDWSTKAPASKNYVCKLYGIKL